ncbi:MAG: response regulator [Alphaproteobacteria bacterium]|nr:response regulator [Alphaproteobacteria bacterium]
MPETKLPLNILGFDDKEVVLGGLQLAARGLGHKFIGIEILDTDDIAALTKEDFKGVDAVITDMDMGDPVAGLKLMRKIRELAPDIKIILNSGSATPEEEKFFDAVLNKTGSAKEQLHEALIRLYASPTDLPPFQPRQPQPAAHTHK